MPDGMKLRVWKMTSDQTSLHFILVMTDCESSKQWLMGKAIFYQTMFNKQPTWYNTNFCF